MTSEAQSRNTGRNIERLFKSGALWQVSTSFSEEQPNQTTSLPSRFDGRRDTTVSTQAT